MGRRAGHGEGSWRAREHSVSREVLWGGGACVLSASEPVFCFFVSFKNFFLIYFNFWFLVALHDMWDLNYQTRDRTGNPSTGSAKALPAREVPESLF